MTEKRKSAENRRQKGFQYEKLAAAYLQSQGYQILEHNYYCHPGEIDLIAKDGRYLVFVEVKYRSSGISGSALEAVDARKQQRINRCAQVYLKHHGISFETPVRFDVVAVDGTRVTLIKNAFGGF